MRTRWTLPVAATLAAAALGCYVWSLWGSPSFGRLGDQAVHLALARDYCRALRDGDLPPRWAATANGGRGSPAFVLYPPMFSALASLISQAAGLPAREAMRWSVLLAAFAVGAGVYFLARAWLSPARSLVAAATVLLLPGTTFVCLGRGMYPQFLALFWVALILGAGARLLRGERTRPNAVILVMGGAGLILTHTLTAYLLALLLLVMVPLLAPALGGARGLARAALPAGATLLLTSWFWIPQVYATSYTRPSVLSQRHPYLEGTFFNRTAAADRYSEDWQFLNQVGKLIVAAQSALAIALALALRCESRRTKNPLLRSLPWVAGLALAASIRPIGALLIKLPGYTMLQFCWRWQVLVALFCGIALASLPRKRHSALPAMLGLVVISFFSRMLAPVTVQPAEDQPAAFAALDEQVLNAMPSQIRASFLDSVLEQRPRGSDSLFYPPGPPGRTEVASGGATITATRIRSSEREYVVASASGAVVRFLTYHCPGWTARVDGAPAVIEAERGTGLQLLRLRSGSHRLLLLFRAAWP